MNLPINDVVLLLTHGAGAPVESDFMQDLANAIKQQGIAVRCFNFNYMQRQVDEGKKRPPSRAPQLEEEFLQQIETLRKDGHKVIFIAGKSMGGRIATHLLADDRLPDEVLGGIAYGYPFHPPGKPDKLRVEHLHKMQQPLLIMQGERDTFGNQHEIATMTLPVQVNCHFLADGDHSLKPRKKSGLTQQQHIQTAAEQTRAFILQCLQTTKKGD